MKNSVAFAGAMTALCAMTLLVQGASAQGLDEKPVHHAPKAVPQLRAPQRVEKPTPKLQERAGVTPTPAAAPEPAPASAQAQAQAQPQVAPPGETQNFQGWTVTCLQPPPDNTPRTCVAKMGVLKSNEDRRPILFMSVIKTGGSATFVLQTPTGIELKAGATVQIGKSAPRRLTYESCEPAMCTAVAPMDDAFVQELAASPSATASWVGIGVGEVRVEYGLQESRNTLAYLVSR